MFVDEVLLLVQIQQLSLHTGRSFFYKHHFLFLLLFCFPESVVDALFFCDLFVFFIRMMAIIMIHIIRNTICQKQALHAKYMGLVS